jgi:hypothetical protein
VQVDILLHVQLRRGAAPLRAENAGSVGIVHNQAGVVFLLQRHDLLQQPDVAVHAVDAVDDDRSRRVFLSRAPENALQVLHVVVPEEKELRAARLRAHKQAGVGPLVENGQVAGAGQGQQRAHHRHHSAGERDRGLTSLEQRNLPLQIEMSLGGAGQQPRAHGRSNAVSLHDLHHVRTHLRMHGQSQVVVGAELQLAPAVTVHPGSCISRRRDPREQIGGQGAITAGNDLGIREKLVALVKEVADDSCPPARTVRFKVLSMISTVSKLKRRLAPADSYRGRPVQLPAVLVGSFASGSASRKREPVPLPGAAKQAHG